MKYIYVVKLLSWLQPWRNLWDSCGRMCFGHTWWRAHIQNTQHQLWRRPKWLQGWIMQCSVIFLFVMFTASMMELVTKDALLTPPAPHPSGWRRRWRCSWPKRRRAAGRTSSRRLCWNFLMHSLLLADYWNCLCFARDSHQSMSIAMHLHHRNAESSWGRILRSLGHLVFRALLSLF